jgi:hypothetical protein
MAVYARDGFRCVWCQRKVKPGTNDRQRRASLDHWVPVSYGGHHGADNLLTCCIPCNSSRGDSHPEDWAESCNWDGVVWTRIQAALSAPLNRALGRTLWAARRRNPKRPSWPEFRHHD